MTIYVVIIKDRHSDLDVHVFKTHSEATSFAIRWCEIYSLDRKYEYHDYEIFESFDYSCEGDSVLIYKKDIEL